MGKKSGRKKQLRKVQQHLEKMRGDLHFDLKEPCPTCPFRKDVPYDYEYQAMLENVMKMANHGHGHTCHYTDARADLPDNAVSGQNTERKQHCAGSLIMLLRQNIAPMMMTMKDIQEARQRLDINDPNIFSLPEFVLSGLENFFDDYNDVAKEAGCDLTDLITRMRNHVHPFKRLSSMESIT